MFFSRTPSRKKTVKPGQLNIARNNEISASKLGAAGKHATPSTGFDVRRKTLTN